MKTIFGGLLAVMFIIGALPANACDVCGCSGSNQYIGILPQFYRHFIGLQYQYRTFSSDHVPFHIGDPPEHSTEQYQTVQLIGRYYISRKVQLLAFVPYHFNRKDEEGVVSYSSGLGDASLLGNVEVLGTKNADAPLQQKLLAGGGLKLPTGRHDALASMGDDGLPNMQPGTGSWDFLANVNYTIRKKGMGVNADVTYTQTTANHEGYKYGNRLSAGLTGFYWWQHRAFRVLPQAGLRYNYASMDWDNYRKGWINDVSGGHQLFAAMGAQGYYKSWGLQLMYYHPLEQQYAGGLVTAGGHTEATFFFLF